MLEWLQDIDWSEGFFVLLVVALGVLVADMFVTEPYTVQGQVIGAEYTPASSGVGTGVSSGVSPCNARAGAVRAKVTIRTTNRVAFFILNFLSSTIYHANYYRTRILTRWVVRGCNLANNLVLIWNHPARQPYLHGCIAIDHRTCVKNNTAGG
ncbi:MAG: hypothetical protein E6Q97_07885 [Desulfurellales bacterium]|nr:MAG: hypothetical protein E6Q97_07885 [Desulfurellales bacterium]